MIALARHSAKIPGSDDSVEREEAHVLTFRDGRLVELAEFPTWELAMEHQPCG